MFAILQNGLLCLFLCVIYATACLNNTWELNLEVFILDIYLAWVMPTMLTSWGMAIFTEGWASIIAMQQHRQAESEEGKVWPISHHSPIPGLAYLKHLTAWPQQCYRSRCPTGPTAQRHTSACPLMCRSAYLLSILCFYECKCTHPQETQTARCQMTEKKGVRG